LDLGGDFNDLKILFIIRRFK